MYSLHITMATTIHVFPVYCVVFKKIWENFNWIIKGKSAMMIFENDIFTSAKQISNNRFFVIFWIYHFPMPILKATWTITLEIYAFMLKSFLYQILYLFALQLKLLFQNQYQKLWIMSVFGLLSGVAGFVKVRYLIDKAIIDNMIFRCHYRITSAILFVCCIIVTANNLIGKQLDAHFV